MKEWKEKEGGRKKKKRIQDETRQATQKKNSFSFRVS